MAWNSESGWAGSLSGSGGSVSGPVLYPDGTVTVPSISFTNDQNTGFYRIGADNLGITIGGILRVNFTTTLATFTTILVSPAGSLAAPSFYFTGDAERGLYLQTNSVGIAGGAHVTGPLTISALATPGSITVTPMGTTGATTYTYKLVATVGGVTTDQGAASSTATCNATLNGTNFNRL